MKKTLFLLFAFIVLHWPSAAQAGEPQLLSTHGAWDAYVYKENGNKVCYMISRPEKQEGDYSKRDDVYALVTHSPAEGSKNVFSYITGYEYKPGSDASVEIDGERHILFTQDSNAWAPDAEGDNKLAKAIRAGSNMIVRGTSTRGTETKDTFNLNGSSGAYDRISKECGI